MIGSKIVECAGWAEIYLVPQMYNARRFGVDLAPFARLVTAVAAAQAMDEFADAHPDRFAPIDPIKTT